MLAEEPPEHAPRIYASPELPEALTLLAQIEFDARQRGGEDRSSQQREADELRRLRVETRRRAREAYAAHRLSWEAIGSRIEGYTSIYGNNH